MKISITGAAGTPGSCTTFNIITHERADEIVMIGGKRQNILLAHRIDFCTEILENNVTLRMGGDENMAGSDILCHVTGECCQYCR